MERRIHTTTRYESKPITFNSKDKSHNSQPSQFHQEDFEDDEEDAAVVGSGMSDDDRKKKKSVAAGRASSGGGGGGGGGGVGVAPPTCQAEKCSADLNDAKRYYRRHKVCEHHSKAPVVIVAGLRQRFCQQCSRFHELLEFDEAKRSCRRRLAGHNERRRKNSSDPHGETQAAKGKTL